MNVVVHADTSVVTLEPVEAAMLAAILDQWLTWRDNLPESPTDLRDLARRLCSDLI